MEYYYHQLQNTNLLSQPSSWLKSERFQWHWTEIYQAAYFQQSLQKQVVSNTYFRQMFQACLGSSLCLKLPNHLGFSIVFDKIRSALVFGCNIWFKEEWWNIDAADLCSEPRVIAAKFHPQILTYFWAEDYTSKESQTNKSLILNCLQTPQLFFHVVFFVALLHCTLILVEFFQVSHLPGICLDQRRWLIQQILDASACAKSIKACQAQRTDSLVLSLTWNHALLMYSSW